MSNYMEELQDATDLAYAQRLKQENADLRAQLTALPEIVASRERLRAVVAATGEITDNDDSGTWILRYPTFHEASKKLQYGDLEPLESNHERPVSAIKLSDSAETMV